MLCLYLYLNILGGVCLFCVFLTFCFELLCFDLLKLFVNDDVYEQFGDISQIFICCCCFFLNVMPLLDDQKKNMMLLIHC